MAEETKNEKPNEGLEFLEWLRTKDGKAEKNYRGFKQYLESRARGKGVPISGQFELTPLCNFDCKMCYVHLSQDRMNGREILSVETWKDLIHQAWEAGMIKASLTGGECLTYPGFDEIFLYLHSLGCEVGVLTNGFLLDEKRLEFFKEHMPALIQVTLYGYDEESYMRVTGRRGFKTVTENIRRAVDAGMPLQVSITPNSFLGRDVLETVRVANTLAKKVIVNSMLFTPREETGRSDQKEDLDDDLYVDIYHLIDEIYGREKRTINADKLPPVGGPYHECSECGLLCGGGRSSFVVDWRGTLMPCNRMNIIHADLLQEGFAAAWKKVNGEACSWPRVPECKGCPYDKVCNHCAGNMLRYAQPGQQPTGLCEKIKYYVQCGVRDLPDCE